MIGVQMPPGFRPAYGWRWHRGELLRDEDEQRVVRYIRRLYALRSVRGKRIFTLKLIADRLYMKGIPPKSCKPTLSMSSDKRRPMLLRWSLPMIAKIIKKQQD